MKKLLIIIGLVSVLILILGYIMVPMYAVPPSLNKARLAGAASDCRQMIDAASLFYKETGRPPKIEEIKSLYPFNRTGPGYTGTYLLYFEGMKNGSPCFSAAFFQKYGVVTVGSDKNCTIKEVK